MIFRKYNSIQNTSRWIQQKIGSTIDPKQKRHAHVGAPELWKKSRDFQIKFLKDMGLMPKNYLLDIGCGTLVGGIPIIRYLEKHHYYGIEVRSDVLEDFIWAASVLIHFKNKILEDCFAFVSSHLSKQGKFYANVNIGNKKDDNWKGFPVVWHTLDFYIEMASSHGLSVKDIGSRQELGLTYQDDQRMLEISRK